MPRARPPGRFVRRRRPQLRPFPGAAGRRLGHILAGLLGSLRLPALLLNSELAPCLVETGVDRWVRGQEHASDHAPAWVRLDLSKLGKKPGVKGRGRGV